MTHPFALLLLATAFTAHAPADTPQAAPQPASQPVVAVDSRPRVAVAGIRPAPGGDPRDEWIATAVEELLTWRLRRCTQLSTSPTQRLYQGQLELSSSNTADAPWEHVARELGATHLISGECRGEWRKMSIAINIVPLATAGGENPPINTKSGSFWDVLDDATDAVVRRLAPSAADDTAAHHARPSESMSAIEYFARAVAASRAGDGVTAARLSRDAADVDPRFRPALGLLAQIELKSPAGGKARAARALRAVLDLARSSGDELDRLNAELALSLIARSDGAPQAALTRAQTALELATAANDAYGRVAAMNWISDLYLTDTGTSDGATTQPSDEALERLRESIRWQRALADLLDALHDRLSALPASTKMALTHERLGDDAAALAAHQRTLRLASELQSPALEAGAWVYLAQFHRARKAWPEARDAAARALERVDDAGKPAVLIMLGSIDAAAGDQTAALGQYQDAYERVRKTDDLGRQLMCLREIARLRHASGDVRGAVQAMQEAVDLAKILESGEHAALQAQLEAWRAAAGRG